MTTISVCVPVYNGAAFIVETLECIAAQTFADFNVLVSVDRSDDSSLQACGVFATDRRFQIIEQPVRLGWIANVNALIDRVEAPFFCITPHDDLLDPRYLEAMHGVHRSDPTAACVFSDIECFGERDGHILQADILGARHERVLDVLLNHYAAVAFRGVVRRQGASDRPYVPMGIPEDFASDTAWMIGIAQRGTLRRVPELLYRKRFIATSVHAAWSRWTQSELLRLYAALVAACTRLALDGATDATEREELMVAGLLRAAGYTKQHGWGTPGTPFEVASVVSNFCALTADFERISDPMETLRRTHVAVLQEGLKHHAMLAPIRSTWRNGVMQSLQRLLGAT